MRTRFAPIFVLLTSFSFILSTGCDGEDERNTPTATLEFEPTDSKRDTPTPSKTEEAPEKTRLIVLGDKRCKDRRCDTTPALKKLRVTLKRLEVIQHDWSEEECQKIFESEGLKHLPAFLFDSSVEKNPGFPKIARFLTKTPRGELKLLKIGADFDPRAEICDNGTDDTGNGRVDCDDPTCAEKVVCREEIPRRLDLFVMSMCPYGTMAMDSMSEVLEAFGRGMDFHIHYIANETEKGFRSLHGQPEVDENIRELCAIKHFAKGNTYMEYIWCRNRTIKEGNWQQCAGKKGINTGVLEKCSTGEEGRNLLREDIKMAQKLGIGASPTWLVNNRFIFHGIAPEVVRENFCNHNKGLKGCEKRLSTKTPRPAGTCE